MKRPTLNRRALTTALAGLAVTVAAGGSAIAGNAGQLGATVDPAPFDAVPAVDHQSSTGATSAPPTSIQVVDEFVYVDVPAPTRTPATPSTATPRVVDPGNADDHNDRDEHDETDRHEPERHEDERDD
jgi:hypothetical protein